MHPKSMNLKAILISFVILISLSGVASATGIDVAFVSQGAGSFEIYANGVYYETISANSYDTPSFAEGTEIDIVTSTPSGYIMENICLDTYCTAHVHSVNYWFVVHTTNNYIKVVFIPLSGTPTDVHGDFQSSDSQMLTYNLFWHQTSTYDIFITVDGYTHDVLSYGSGYNFHVLYYVVPYGSHEFCVNDVCTTGTNIEPSPSPTPTPTPTQGAILTIVQIVGNNGTVEVYDNDNMIGSITSSHSFNVTSGHNVTVHGVANTGFHVDKICDQTGCSSGTSKITYINSL